jgi:putative spermidine/putrescine transport system substrate-binding protein
MFLDRRSFLQLGLAATASGACPRLALAAEALRATHFGGPYAALADLVAKPFAAARLGEVEYQVEQPSIIVSKWQADAAHPLYDLALMVPSFALRAQTMGLVASVQRSEFPNLADTVPAAFPEEGYGVQQLLDSLTVMFDKRQLSKPFESWLDFWRPDLKGKIALPALPLAGGTMIMVVMTTRAMGGSERNDKDVDEAFKKLRELKAQARVFYTDPIQATQLTERGEVVAALQYGARIGQAMRANDFIGRASPKEGMPASAQSLVIAKNSPRQALAKAYINFILSEPVQKALSERFLIAPVNKNVQVAPELAPFVNNDYSKLLFLDEAFVGSKLADWADRYRREVQS